MKRLVRALGALALAAGSMAITTAVVLAAWSGGQNGRDLNIDGWIGNDNPDGLTGTYSVDNVWQDAVENEWDEPFHDWVHDKFLRWGPAAETKLDQESADKALEIEFRVHDETYYNFTGNWNSNLPWSKAAESENPLEEFGQHYTEIDTEIQEPAAITENFNYFVDLQLDAEKPSVANAPTFYTEIEYCNNFFLDCNYDVTGWMRKKVVVQ